MRREKEASKDIVTADDLTALFEKLGSDWAARKEEEARRNDPNDEKLAGEQVEAFETMATCMDSMAQANTAPAWTKAEAAAYLERMSDSCRKSADELRGKMGDDFVLVLMKDAEARAYRQAALVLKDGHFAAN